MSLPHSYPQCMWLHEHTWTHMSCTSMYRLKSTCKLINPEYWHQALASPHIHCQACNTDHVRVTTLERLDQGHLHPKLEVPRLACLSRELKYRASEVGGKHSSKELFEQLVNSYSEHLHMNPRHGYPQCMWLQYMNIHGHIWAALVCRPHSTCELLNPEYRNQHLQVRIFTVKQDRSRQGTTLERLDQGHLHPKLVVPRLTCLSRELNPGLSSRRQALTQRTIKTAC